MARKKKEPAKIQEEPTDVEETEVEDDLVVTEGDDEINDYNDDDYDDIEEESTSSSSRRSSVDDLKAIDFEVALRANPKRAKYQRKAARPLDGVSSVKDLADPEKAKKVWKKIEKTHSKDKAKTYKVDEDYELEDIINHPTFGRGYVVEILSNTKFAVLFEDGLRRLMYNMKPS